MNDKTVIHESNIGKLSTGALGGKGRGIAFINSLIYNFSINKYTPGIKIKMPKTFIIGTDEYDRFISENDLLNRAGKESDFNKISQMFLKTKLSSELANDLKKILRLFSVILGGNIR